MFKFSKKFKLFSNIKRVVSSSLIVCAIFSNVSLGAVSLQEASTFVQNALCNVTEAKELCMKMYQHLDHARGVNKSNVAKKLRSIFEYFNAELGHLNDLLPYLNVDKKSKLAFANEIKSTICNEDSQLRFYEGIFGQLKEMVTILSYLNYSGRHANYNSLKDLLVLTYEYILDLKNRICNVDNRVEMNRFIMLELPKFDKLFPWQD